MSKSNLVLAQEYLQAWDKKDVEGISKRLHPEVRFISPMAQVTGKERVLESAKRMFPMLRAVKVRSTFGAGDQVMAAYDFVCAEPIGVCRTAELLSFKEGLISGIELFFDAAQ